MLIITRGPAASGKDTWAREFQKNNPEVVIINRDDFRIGTYRTAFGPPIDEDYITDIEHNAVRKGLQRGLTVISSNTNLSAKNANALVWIAYAEGHDVELVNHFKDIPLEECIRRDKARERTVGAKVISEQWQRAQKNYTLPPQPAPVQPYDGTPGQPDAVLVDLDGTSFLIGDRSPYSETEYDKDTPSEAVRQMALGLRAQGIRVIYFSARTENARAMTEVMLARHDFPYGPLFMRNIGDKRKDWVVKNEMFNIYIKDNYNILFCIDDRNQVIDMWRKKGIVAMQVADGDF